MPAATLAPLRFELVAAVIADALRIEPARVTPCVQLAKTLACDSLDRQTIAAELDMAFAIELPDDHVAHWKTALDVARSVASLRAGEAH